MSATCRPPIALSLLLLLAPMAHGVAQGRRTPPQDTLFIVPGSHLDIGFTAPISRVREERIRILDQAIATAQRDPTFVWFEEGGWVVEAWLDRYQSQPSRLAALRSLVVQGRIGVGATLLSPYAAAFPDGLRLMTSHLDRVQRLLGVRPSVAVINDVPAMPEALVDALAAAGIHYLLAAPNLTFSPPLPGALVKQPFYWQSSRGAKLLVYLDTDGYGAGGALWGMPPECGAAMNPRSFPRELGADSIIARGLREGLRRRGNALPLLVVQLAFDNWDSQCAALLPAAVARGNAMRLGVQYVAATPEKYFQHLERRFGPTLPVRRGEWGGDWDLLRATEPVWSWRLREATRGVTTATSAEARRTLATAMDHNVGLGPRWMDGLSTEDALRHVREVAALYRSAVSGVLGEKGVTALPAVFAAPPSAAWPREWSALVGDRAGAARVRAGGPGFLHPMIDDSAAVVATSITVGASADRMVVSVPLDRDRLEKLEGPRRFGVVIEVRLNRPIAQIRLAPVNSPAGLAGQWLLGNAPATVISPGEVQVMVAGSAIRVRGPLIVGWSLMRDAKHPEVTWLQALAFIDALEGKSDRGALRRSFAEFYPGEPGGTLFELELLRLRSP